MQQLKPGLQQSEGRSKPWSGSRLINAYAEASDGDKVETFAIMAIPGLDAFSTLATSPVRGVHVMAEALYAVAGSVLYSVTSAGVATALGAIGGTGPVQMANNGTQLAVCPNNGVGYVLDSGVIYSGILNLPAVSNVIFVDGYFLWTAQNSDQFIISGLNDGLVYDPLDVATVEGDPDFIVGCVNDHREVHFYGTKTTEIWFNSGGADFPFERQGNAFIERGCRDRDSLVKVDNSVFFVGDDLIVYRLNGYTPQRISSHPIETAIAGASWFRAFTYSQEGHKFYVLNTDLGTHCLDVATNLWADRQSYGLDTYRVGCAERVYGQTIMGDQYSGKLYVPNLDSYDEDGQPMPVIVEIPTIEKNRDRVTMYALELFCETGVGNGDDPDPQVSMQYSRDGGRIWSNEMMRSLGAVGTYETRAVWRPNVQFRTLALRFTLSSKTRRFVIGYYGDIR